MLNKQFILSWLAAFVAMNIYGFGVYVHLLADFYAANLGEIAYRPEGTEKMEWLMLGYILMSYTMVRIFIHGYKDKGTVEAVRFGLLVGVFWSSIEFFNYAFMPGTFNAMWVGFFANIGFFIFTSIIMAKVYKITGANS